MKLLILVGARVAFGIPVIIQVQQAFTEYDALEKEVKGDSFWLGSYNVAAYIAAYDIINKNSKYVTSISEFSEMCPELDFEFKFTDYHSSAQIAVQNAINEYPDFIVGLESSSPTSPLAILAGALNIPMTSYYATSGDLDDIETFPTFSRTIPSDASTVEQLSKLLEGYELQHVGMIYLDDSYGSAYRDSLQLSFFERNIKLHATGYTYGNNHSIHLSVEAIKSSKINVIVIASFGEDFVEIIKYAVAIGLTGGDYLFIFTDSVGSYELSTAASLGEEYEAALHRQQWLQAFGGNNAVEGYNHFADDWQHLFDSDVLLKTFIEDRLPGGKFFVPSSYNASYDNVADIGMPYGYFSSTFENIESIAPFAYDSVVTAARSLCFAYNTSQDLNGKTGKYAATLWNDPKFAFVGLSNWVSFDNVTNSRNPSTVNYQVKSIHTQGGGFQILNGAALKSDGTWDTSSIIFPSGLTTPPPDVQFETEELNQISLGLRIVGMIFTAIIELICIGFILWVTKHRNATIIVKSQPQFLVICLLGVMTSTFAIIPLGIDDSQPYVSLSASCNATWWLWSIGTTMVYAALITKMWRVLRIFKNTSLRALKITNWDLYKKMLLILAVNLLFLMVWVSVAPLEWVRYVNGDVGVIVDDYGHTMESYGECRGYYDEETGSYVSAAPFVGTIILFHFFLLGITTFIGYKVRHVDSNFQESSYLFIASGSMLQLYTLLLLVWIAIGETETELQYIVLLSVISINNFVLIMLLMVPKVVNFNSPSPSTFPNNQFTGSNTIEIPKSMVESSNNQDSDIEMPLPSLTFGDMFGRDGSGKSQDHIVTVA